MTTYFLFLGTIFFLSLMSKNDIKKFRSNMFYWIITLIAFLFSALRFDVGWDYSAYYNTIVNNLSTNIVNNREILTILLVKLSQFLHIPQLYFIINSAICILLISVTINKYSKDKYLSLIFFITFPLFYLNSFSVIRNFTAIAIVFYAFKYIVEDKLLNYIIVIIIASLFHFSALIALPFYFFKYFRFDKLKNVIIIFFIIPILKKIIEYLILKYFPRYSYYLYMSSEKGGTKAIYVLIFITILFLLFKRKIDLNENNVIKISYNIFACGICIYLTFFNKGTMGHRLSLYGTIHVLLLFPEIINVFSIKDRIIVKYILYIFCIIFFFYTINIGKETYIPYKLFF